MDRTIHASARARTATAGAIAVAYVAIAFGQGGYSTTAVAWGAIVLWAIVAAGIALRAWPGAEVSRLAAGAVACFGALAILSLLSMAWADDAGRAFAAALLPAAYAGLLLAVVLVLPAIRPRTWLLGIVAGAVAITSLALASRLFPGFLGGGEATLVSLGATGRLSYPIGYWNALAACIAVAIVLLAWLGSQADRRGTRAAAIGLIVPCALALYLTSSRGGALAVALGVGVLLALGPARTRLGAGAVLGLAAAAPSVVLAIHSHDLAHDLGTSTQSTQGLHVTLLTLLLAAGAAGVRWLLDAKLAAVQVSRRFRRAALIGLALALVVGIVASDPAARVRDFTSDTPGATAVPGQRSLLATGGSGRAQFWKAALDAFAGDPAGGVGAGNYELYWNAHPGAPTATGNAHSLFLEELADLGPLGLLLAIGPVVAAGVAARRCWRRVPADVAPALALLATTLVGAAIDWTWKVPASFVPGVIAIGLLTGPARSRSTGGDASSGARRFGLGVAALLFAVVVLAVAGVFIYASTRLADSKGAVVRGDLAAAVSDARSAADAEPFSPEPQLQLALTYKLAGQLGAAREAAQRAIQKAPGDWRGWAVASGIDRRRGATGAATAEAARAQALAPVPLPASALPGPG